MRYWNSNLYVASLSSDKYFVFLITEGGSNEFRKKLSISDAEVRPTKAFGTTPLIEIAHDMDSKLKFKQVGFWTER